MYGSRLQHTIVLIATALLVISFLTYYTHNISYFSPLHALSSLSASWPLSQSLPPSTSVSSNLLGKVHDAYNTTDLLKFATKRPDGNYYPPQYTEYGDNPIPRIRAGFIVLVRNSELDAMKASMKQVEDKFNKNFNYPWIFLNSECRKELWTYKKAAHEFNGLYLILLSRQMNHLLLNLSKRSKR